MNIKTLIESMRKTIVPHPYYELAFKRLYNQCVVAQPGSVITVVGPTRVGKTTLSLRLQDTLVDQAIQNDSQYKPIIRVEAATTDQGFISTRYLTLQLLLALEHPFHVDSGYSIRMRDPESEYRRQLVSALKARQTKYIIFDEAHHMLRTKSNRLIESVLDSMKCLGNETGCVVIFIGGYDLLRYQFLSAHLNGRLTVIEFPNYGIDPEGLQGFDRLLVTVDAWLPWAARDSLYLHRDQIYEGSLGCYGQLVHWSINALAEMCALGDKVLKVLHFKTTRHTAQIRVIKADIERGKQMLSSLADEGAWDEDAGDGHARLNTKEQIKSKNRPFHRKPKRDPVNVKEGASHA